jgi:hypothetical protein
MRNAANREETPREKFKRLAAQRTNAIIKRIQILGNCSNRYVYEYEEADIEKIFSEIERCLRETKLKYKFRKKRNEFKL